MLQFLYWEVYLAICIALTRSQQYKSWKLEAPKDEALYGLFKGTIARVWDGLKGVGRDESLLEDEPVVFFTQPIAS
jgi:hypothetical protein